MSQQSIDVKSRVSPQLTFETLCLGDWFTIVSDGKPKAVYIKSNDDEAIQLFFNSDSPNQVRPVCYDEAVVRAYPKIELFLD